MDANANQMELLALTGAAEQAADIAEQAMQAFADDHSRLRAQRLVDAQVLVEMTLPAIQQRLAAGPAQVADIAEEFGSVLRHVTGHVDMPMIYCAIGVALSHPQGIDLDEQGRAILTPLFMDDSE